MANDFVNTITTKDGTTYNVQDKRLEVTAADAGKIVSVNEQGELTLVSAPTSGTQLYQHIIELEVTSEGESYTATLRLINTSSASLADKRWGQLIPYISTTIYGVWDETPVVSIINEQDETRIICYDQWGNLQELRPNWDGEYGGFTGPDTVTAL